MHVRCANVLRVSAVTLLLSAASARADRITDPSGDVFGPVFPNRPEIVSYSADSGPTSVPFIVNFAGPISPPSAFQPPDAAAPSVIGTIDVDTDMIPGV